MVWVHRQPSRGSGPAPLLQKAFPEKSRAFRSKRKRPFSFSKFDPLTSFRRTAHVRSGPGKRARYDESSGRQILRNGSPDQGAHKERARRSWRPGSLGWWHKYRRPIRCCATRNSLVCQDNIRTQQRFQRRQAQAPAMTQGLRELQTERSHSNPRLSIGCLQRRQRWNELHAKRPRKNGFWAHWG